MSFEKIFRKTKSRFFGLVCCWLVALSFLSAHDEGLGHRKKLEDFKIYTGRTSPGSIANCGSPYGDGKEDE